MPDIASGETEHLPEGIVIMSGADLPLDCKPLADGGFLLCGLSGEEGDSSIESYFYHPREADEKALAESRPLSGYVAAYDADGTRRWIYQLSEAAPYQGVFAQPVEGGNIVCREMRYIRLGEYVSWEETVDAFLLDSNGNYIRRLPWLIDLSNSAPRRIYDWARLLPEGVLHVTPFTESDIENPENYLPMFTMYDLNGQMQWRSSPDAFTGYYTFFIEPVMDGYMGYAVHLSAHGTPTGELINTCLFKLDKSGNLVWQEKIVDLELLDGMMVRMDGSILGTGSKIVLNEGDALFEHTAFLRSYDANGRLLQHAGLEAYQLLAISRAFEASDGRTYLVGWIDNQNVLIALDTEGTPVEYTWLFGKAGRRTFPDLPVEGPDGLYLVGTMTEKNGDDRWYVLPLNEDTSD